MHGMEGFRGCEDKNRGDEEGIELAYPTISRIWMHAKIKHQHASSDIPKNTQTSDKGQQRVGGEDIHYGKQLAIITTLISAIADTEAEAKL